MKLILSLGGIAYVASTIFTATNVNEHMLESVSIPKGNMLVWIAYLNNALQSEGRSEKIVLVPVMPQIEIVPTMMNDVVLAQWLDEVRTLMVQSLSSSELDWGVGRIQDEIKITFTKFKEVISILQAMRCRVTQEGRYIFVYPFPEHLEVLCYSSDVKFIIALYPTDESGVFVYEHSETGKAYALAPRNVHDKMYALLKELTGAFSDIDSHIQGRH